MNLKFIIITAHAFSVVLSPGMKCTLTISLSKSQISINLYVPPSYDIHHPTKETIKVMLTVVWIINQTNQMHVGISFSIITSSEWNDDCHSASLTTISTPYNSSINATIIKYLRKIKYSENIAKNEYFIDKMQEVL